MISVLPFAALLFGAIIGSFLNALSFRYRTGRGMGGRSRCMHCCAPLRAADLVPVFSYLALRGRCRHCRSRISLQYPIVETIAAITVLAVYLRHPEPVAFVFWMVVWMALLFIVVYDMRHSVLAGGGLGILLLSGLISLWMPCAVGCSFATPDWWAFMSGPILGVPLLALSFISGGRWMGWGDGILAWALGWLAGLSSGFVAVLLAFWSGAIIGVALIFFTRFIRPRLFKKRTAEVTLTSEIPFAPFLAFGMFVAHFFNLDILSLLGM